MLDKLTVKLQCGAKKIRDYIHRSKPFASDTNLEYIKYRELINANAKLGKDMLYTSLLF